MMGPTVKLLKILKGQVQIEFNSERTPTKLWKKQKPALQVMNNNFIQKSVTFENNSEI